MPIRTSKLVVFIRNGICLSILILFPLSTFAEYYLVRNRIYKDACPSIPVYQKKSSIHQSSVTHRPKLARNNNACQIYYPCREKNYNLDLITGDDDPYIYPGMNIDR